MATEQAATSQRNWSWLKYLLAALLLLLVLLATVIFTLPYTLPKLLRDYGIELEISQPNWSGSSFQALQLKLDYQEHHLNLEEVLLEWQLLPPRLNNISITKASGQLAPYAFANNQEQDTDIDSELALDNYLSYLPKQIKLEQLDLELVDIGQLQGSIKLSGERQADNWQPSNSQFELTLTQLNPELLEDIDAQFRPQQLSINAKQLSSNDEALLLAITGAIDGGLEVLLAGQLKLSQTPAWQLALMDANLELHSNGWQLDGLTSGQSNFKLENVLLSFPLASPSQIQLELGLSGKLEQLSHQQLHPQNWLLAGQISGNLEQLTSNISLHGEHGIEVKLNSTWLEERLNAELELASTNLKNNNPLSRTLTGWPSNYQILQGEYMAKASFDYQQQQANGRLFVQAQDIHATAGEQKIEQLNIKLGGLAQLKHNQDFSHWQLDFNRTGIGFVLDSYQDANTKLQQLSGGLVVQGHINQDELAISLSQDAVISSEKNRLYQDLHSNKIALNLNHFELSGPYQDSQQLRLNTKLNAQLDNLNSKQLKAQDWSLIGEVNGKLENLNGHIKLNSQHGFQLDNRFTGNPDKFNLNSQLARIDFSQGNPIEKTLRSWPELLNLSSGTVDNNLQLSYHSQRPITANFNSKLSGINGIYNSSELSAVNIELDAQVAQNNINAKLPRFSINAVNPGIPLSAINISAANYQAPLDNPLAGQLSWDSIFAQLLQGNLYSADYRLNLTEESLVLVELQGLQLSELMRVYPTDGLAGHGSIDGQLPLLVSLDGIRINDGLLEASSPGQLQFRSPEMQQMARSNFGLQVLNDALEDFNFSVLRSDLNFAKDGKLVLGMRMEGRNPKFENGRPVHFNFNLEQNLFALLASIQISNHVNELILRRIQQRAEQK